MKRLSQTPYSQNPRGPGTHERLQRAPTSRPSDDVTNGKVAQELPVAPALLIGRVIAS